VSLNVLFVAVAASRSVVIVRPARRGQQQMFDKANWKAAVVSPITAEASNGVLSLLMLFTVNR
jgi:hypothetical protein